MTGMERWLFMPKNKNESYLGGAAAIANHLASFCKTVKFLTLAGKEKENLNFIKKLLRKNISIKFFNKKNSSTIIKKRYIDEVTKNKLLGVYHINDDILKDNSEKVLINFIKKNIPYFDLILVSDYGHGFISKKTAAAINSSKIFFSFSLLKGTQLATTQEKITHRSLYSIIVSNGGIRLLKNFLSTQEWVPRAEGSTDGTIGSG